MMNKLAQALRGMKVTIEKLKEISDLLDAISSDESGLYSAQLSNEAMTQLMDISDMSFRLGNCQHRLERTQLPPKGTRLTINGSIRLFRLDGQSYRDFAKGEWLEISEIDTEFDDDECQIIGTLHDADFIIAHVAPQPIDDEMSISTFWTIFEIKEG